MPGTRNSEVLCVGRLYCDLIFSDVPRLPTPGTEVYANGLELHLGGGAVITAQHLDSLGRGVALSAFLPTPPFQDYCNEALRQASLDLSLCAPAQESLDPQITVAITSPQDRAFLTRRSGQPFPELAVEDLAIRNIRHLHIGKLASLAERPGLLDLAREVGATVSLDCSWDETLNASVTPLIAAVDVFLPNEEEVSRLIALGLSEPFAPLTATKRGAKGATAQKGGKTHSAPSAVVPVVDTTGAGDAFNAGFLTAWLEGADLDSCLISGNRRGGEAVQVVGDSPLCLD